MLTPPIKPNHKKRLAIEQALHEADQGLFVSHENMRDWFASLGSKNALPFPKPDICLQPLNRHDTE